MLTTPIAVVDYGHGNLGSILNMLRKLGGAGTLVSDARVLEDADKIILPGVGAFDSGMGAIKERGLRDVLIKKVAADKTPLLGICLGMQLLGQSSEEGMSDGLSLIPGCCRRFPSDGDPRFKVPRMGWSEVVPSASSRLFAGIEGSPRFYFVHSYYFECNRQEDMAASANYSIQYAAAIERENIFGVQFHPEKSHRFGMQLLLNFMNLPC